MRSIWPLVPVAVEPRASSCTRTGDLSTSSLMTTACGKYGRLRSMGRAGMCWDNAGAESLWSTFKHEHYYRHSYVYESELVAAVDNWFDYYNARRRHSTIGMLSPHRLRDVIDRGPSGRVTTLHYPGGTSGISKGRKKGPTPTGVGPFLGRGVRLPNEGTPTMWATRPARPTAACPDCRGTPRAPHTRCGERQLRR